MKRRGLLAGEPDSTAGGETAERRRKSLLLARVRVASALATLLVPAGSILEVMARPEYAPPILRLRLVFAVLTALVFTATFFRRLERYAVHLSLLVTLIVAVGIDLILFTVAGPTSGYYAGLIVLVLTVGLLFPWTAFESAGAGLLIVGSYVLPALVLVAPGDRTQLFMNAYMLVNAVMIAVVANHLGTALLRREHRTRHDLEARTGELAEATSQLESSIARLEELDRLKDRFFANISHELRTPLTLILAPLDEVLARDTLDPELRRDLELVRRNGLRLLRLITDLLDLTRLGEGRGALNEEVVALEPFSGSILEEFRPLADRSDLALSAEGEGPDLVVVDPDKLGTILRNLLSNAVKFTGSGGRVTLRRAQDAEGWYLEVVDTGPGIASEHVGEIFDRFMRIEDGANRVGGTGIGLALVKELVELHGGKVEVESRLGEGTTFRVRLPHRTLPDNHVRPRAEPEPSSPWPDVTSLDLPVLPPPVSGPRSECILVAEDESDMRHFLVSLLGRSWQVLEAPDGAAALELARREHPDLILADVMMPGLTGYELTRALKNDPATAAVPVVLLTARRDPESVVRGFDEGANDWVEKPFHPRELLARVEAQLRLRELGGELAESRKAAMLGTLAAGLAHEVRNPAASILAGAAAIRKRHVGADRDPTVTEMIDIIEDSAQRISGLVGDLLDFAHLRRNGGRAWDPEDALERALRLLAWRAEGVVIERAYRTSRRVQGDPARLEQMVMTLLDNALRAAGPEGHLWIGLEDHHGEVLLTVRDDGPGIEPDLVARVFDPFFTTRPVGQGTGLGLYVAKQAAESHGGRIEVEPGPQGGTLFRVRLPGMPDESPGRARGAAVEAAR